MSGFNLTKNIVAMVMVLSLAGCASNTPQAVPDDAEARSTEQPTKQTMTIDTGYEVDAPAPVGTNIKKKSGYRRGGSSYSIKTIGRSKIEEQGGATADDVLKGKGK